MLESKEPLVFEASDISNRESRPIRKSNHRNDLQSIRGLANVFVLAFHLAPDRFRLGFVGVDMFFVLSGFLICGMVRSSTVGFKETLNNFYLRRLRRIVPIYYIVLAVTFCATAFFVTLNDRAQVVRDLKWSVTFSSNMQPFLEQLDYWDMVDSYRFFVHTWSLGVELQFYLIAPFMYAFAKRLNIAIPLHVAVAICSLAYQLTSPTAIAYGFLLSRIWQFNAGAIVAMCSEQNDNIRLQPFMKDKVQGGTFNNKIVVLEISLVFFILAVIVSPKFINGDISRIAYTLLTARIVYSGSRLLCTTWPLVVLGDWSYVAYLIHWPIIVGYKYYRATTTLSWTECSTLFIIIIALSYVAHICIEKRILKTSYNACCIITAACFVALYLNYTIYNKDSFLLRDDKELKHLIAFNTDVKVANLPRVGGMHDPELIKWTGIKDYNDLRGIAYGNGTLKVLMLGNSICYRLQPLVYDILKDKLKELRLFSRNGCYNLQTVQEEGVCRDFHKPAQTIIENSRPDIIIYSAPWTPRMYYEKDPSKAALYAKEFQEYITYASNRSRIIVIDIPYHLSRIKVGPEIVRRLRAGRALTDLKVTREEAFATRKIQKAIMRNVTCANCVYSKVDEAVFEGDFYYLYNRKNLKAYTIDGFHFTREGLELVRGHYTKLLNDVVEKLESKSHKH